MSDSVITALTVAIQESTKPSILAYFTAVFTFILTLVAVLSFVLAKRIKVSEHLKPLNEFVRLAGSLTAKILPGVLDRFEKKGFAPKGSTVRMAEVTASAAFNVESPKVLNDYGIEILESSGLNTIIDDNYDYFASKLDGEEMPKNGLVVEERAFYAISEQEDNDMLNQVQAYLYENPDRAFDTVVLIGSIYLRDEYLKNNPNIVPEPEPPEVNPHPE